MATNWGDFKSYEFTIATKLAETADDWESIRRYRYSANEGDWQIRPKEEKELFGDYKYEQDLTLFGLYDLEGVTSKTLWVKVSLTGTSQGSIIIYESKTDDPDYREEYTPIDITKGAHFTVTVNEPGSLKQRLTNAVFQTDEDLVDYLTVKGKLGGADIAYLQAQEGLVSQLQYLDISEVELVYDDEPYYQNGTSSFYSKHTNIFTLSAENKDEKGPYGGLQGQVSVSSTYCRRNDLSHAFEKMQYLKECYLPKTLPAVGDGMFNQTRICKVGMPTSPTYIGDYAFYDESANWEGGENLPGGLLTTIDIPASVGRIGERAFMGQPLQAVEVGAVTVFGEHCFSRTCLKSIQLSDKVESIPVGMFEECKKLQTINIPASVVEIGEKAFYNCEKLTSVTTGDGIKKIGANAFADCRKLTEMTIASTVEEIGYRAFYNVPYVENIAAENGVKYIGKVAYARDWQTAGAELNIKEGTVSLADHFAYDVESLTSIELPESLEKIGDRAFYNCTKLRRITIPKNVTYIGGEAFEYSALVRVYYNAIDVENVNNGWSSSPFPESITRVIIGEGVKSIPANLFNGCKNIARVEMPSTVERIGDYAFANCTSLVSIDLPATLSYLGKYSLACGSLTSVMSYMQNPMTLFEPDISGIAPDANGSIFSNVETPFGSNAGYVIYINNGSVTSWEVEQNSQIPLLKVPNGSLAAYTGDKTWTAQFQKIEQFDGASSTETIAETTTVSVSNTVTEETDLTSAMMGSVYVTLDTEGSGDGYNATEGCLVINSTTSEEGLAAATADGADDLTVKNQFNGLILEVPGSKGKIIVDCQTLGQNVVFVKIGDAAPQKINTNSRQQLSVPYDVQKDTRIYIYAAKSAAEANNSDSRAAYANDDAVKIYGMTVQIDNKALQPGDANADGEVNVTDIVATVNKIMGHEDASFNIEAADVNSDGEINVTDIVMMVNIIMTSGSRYDQQAVKAMLKDHGFIFKGE
ncbi:MAG: leucine-rich repeat protein [Prevotella sp.]|nr:leucine-rich repeat protein [Prevotella sp.]